MLLYRHFRKKKYGEPLPEEKKEQEGEIEDMFKDDTDMLKKIQNMLQQNFNMEAIEEDKQEDDVDEISDFEGNKGEEAEVQGTVSTKEQAREHVQAAVESKVIAKLLNEYAAKILLVHQFLLMCVLRRRFKRKMNAIPKIQRFLRVGLAKNKVQRRKTEIKEKERRRRMEIYTRLHKNQAKLNDAARLI